jgi:hypothetical protein
MFNFQVQPERLAPRVPRGTELDLFQGKAFASIVAFKFLGAKLLGIPVPFHRDFAEVNLRFYVRRIDDPDRRGVVFIKEIAPRWLVSLVARLVYHENYATARMRHRIRETRGGSQAGLELEYAWRSGRRWNRLWARGVDEPQWPAPGSVEQFLVEHHWGYSAQPDGGCLEYRVDHGPWRVRHAIESNLDCDAAGVYGSTWAACLQAAPHSVLLVEGSPVAVHRGVRL